VISAILDNLAEGIHHEKILQGYPSLRKRNIQATLAYADEFAEESATEPPWVHAL
jgi:uncharacterized protein (DUF433 family)